VSTETSLITFENWTLRIRPPAKQQAGQAKRIVLMLHGWRGDENSMWIFAQNFPADCWLVAPRAPYIAEEGGYTWRAPGSGDWPSVDNLRPAAQALLRLLDAWAAANQLDASHMDVTGFSQGAALAFMLSLLYPARVGKMGILAGFAPEGAEQMLAPAHFNGKKIFVAHGLKDERVPIEQARRTVSLLEGAGAHVTYCESEVGHKLSADCLKALVAYLA
jgi:phospholipase/carboxylesterase